MSKTYRRKNAHTEYDYTYERECDMTLYCGLYYFNHYIRYLEGDELKRSLAQYHSDMYNGWSVHAYFRRDLNRKHRSKNKAILNRAVRQYNDEPMFIPDYNTVEWEYW